MQPVDEDRTLRQNRTIRRNRGRLAGLLAVAAVPVLLAGCGGSSESDTVTPAGPVSSAPSTELTITVDEGGGKTDDWTLSCDPAGGTHPKPAEACAALAAKGKTAIPPVSQGVMCTQIFGGAQTAKITGTWDGKPVNASFSRQNGCEVTRWKALEGLLPVTAGAVGAG
jgi:hypothetical protein